MRRFGKKCDTREYMKLASLLQTNIKKGNQPAPGCCLEHEVNGIHLKKEKI